MTEEEKHRARQLLEEHKVDTTLVYDDGDGPCYDNVYKTVCACGTWGSKSTRRYNNERRYRHHLLDNLDAIDLDLFGLLDVVGEGNDE